MTMRILHINANYIYTKLHQTMLEHFDGKNIVNKVFVPVYDKNQSVIIPNDNVIVSECFRKWYRLLFWYKQHKIFNSLLCTYDVKSFDLIHAHTLFTDGNCARKIFKKYGIPYIVAIRNTDINSFFKKAFWLRSRGIQIMKDASAIIFLSPAYKKEVFFQYVPPENASEFERKTYIVPNGIDDYWLNNININKDSVCVRNRINLKNIRLVYAGEISRNKNLGLTVKAVKILQQDGYDVRYCAVGKIKDDCLYKRITKEPFVHYVEPQEKERLINQYRDNDIFVMPSHTETFGLVYAEAMSQGLPLIYTRGQGFDGQFEDGKVGYSVDSNSAEEIAGRIIDICNNYEEMSHRCLCNVNKFNWAAIASRYTQIYEKIRKDVKR